MKAAKALHISHLSYMALCAFTLSALPARAGDININNATELSGFTVTNGDSLNILSAIAATGNISRITNKTTNLTINGNNNMLTGGDGSSTSYVGFAFGNDGNINTTIGNGTLTLQGLNMTGFYNGNSGGALCASGQTWSDFDPTWVTIPNNYTVLNSTFTNNASNTYGGAVYINLTSPNAAGETRLNPDPNIRFAGDTFIGNKSGSYGGAIDIQLTDIDKAAVTVTNSHFENNESQRVGGGGAMRVNQAVKVNDLQVLIENSTFSGNISTGGNGGALLLTAANGAVGSNKVFNATIRNSTFTNNSAQLGNAINVQMYDEQHLSIIDSTFSANGTAAKKHSTAYISGKENSSLTIDGSEFSSNTGRGLYLAGYNNFWATITNTKFQNNTSTSSGGAAILYDWGDMVATFIDTEMTGNTGTKGGALMLDEGDGIVIALNKNNLFSGNTATTGSGHDIMVSDDSNLYLNANAATGSKIILNSGISSAGTGTININNNITYNTLAGQISAPTSGEVQINNTSANLANLFLNGGTLAVGQDATINAGLANPDGVIDGSSLTVNGGTLKTANGVIGTLTLNSLMLNHDLALNLDVDLVAKTTDTISATTGTLGTYGLTITGLTLLNDATEDTTEVPLALASDLLAVTTSTVTSAAYSPIYRYDVSYDPATAKFTFVKKNNSKPSDNNPYVYSGTVSGHTIGFVQNKIFNHILLSPVSPFASSSVISGKSSGDKGTENHSVWGKVLGFDDHLKAKDFAGIDAQSITLLGGYNFRPIELAGTPLFVGAYAGYTAGKEKFASNKIYQQGGLVGASIKTSAEALFAGLSLNGGFMHNREKNMYGTDKYNNYWLGAGARVGYYFSAGSNLFLYTGIAGNYTFVSTDSYTSASTAYIKTEDLHLWEAAPELKIATNLDEDWRLSAWGKYVFVINQDSSTIANGIILPNLSAKDYVEYGLEIKKFSKGAWNFAAELGRREGGRRGWNGSITAQYNF